MIVLHIRITYGGGNLAVGNVIYAGSFPSTIASLLAIIRYDQHVAVSQEVVLSGRYSVVPLAKWFDELPNRVRQEQESRTRQRFGELGRLLGLG